MLTTNEYVEIVNELEALLKEAIENYHNYNEFEVIHYYEGMINGLKKALEIVKGEQE